MLFPTQSPQLKKILQKLSFSFGLMILGFLNANQVIFAAVSPTPTVTLPATSVTDVPASQAGTVNNNLKKVIDKVVEENKAVVDAKIQALKNPRRGQVGEVKSIREGMITINSLRGTQIIPTDKDVVLIKNNKIISADGISVGDWITVLGIFKDDAFKAEKIIVSNKSLTTSKPEILLGTIEKASNSELKLKNRKTNDDLTWMVTKTTLWQDSQGNKAAISNFGESQQVFAVGIKSADLTTKGYIIRALAPFAKPTQKKSTQ